MVRSSIASAAVVSFYTPSPLNVLDLIKFYDPEENLILDWLYLLIDKTMYFIYSVKKYEEVLQF